MSFPTVLRQVFIHDQLPVPKVVKDGSEVRGVPVDQVGPGLVLRGGGCKVKRETKVRKDKRKEG